MYVHEMSRFDLTPSDDLLVAGTTRAGELDDLTHY